MAVKDRGALLSSIGASLVVLAVYVGVLFYMPLDVFWHPDEGAKFIGLRTVRWSAGVAYSLPYPGRRLDPEYRFYPAGGTDAIYPAPQKDGSVQFRWPILFQLLTLPAFDAFGIAGIYLLPVLGGWLTATLAGMWTYLFRPRATPLAILLAGLGTPLAFYSLSFFEHTLTTLLASIALSLVILRPGRGLVLLAVVPLLALAVVLRGEMVAFVMALSCTWLMTFVALRFWQPAIHESASRRRWVFGVVVAAMIIAAVLMLRQFIPARHLDVLTNWEYGIDRMWFKGNYFFNSLVRIFLGDPIFDSANINLAWEVVGLMALTALIAAPFADTWRIEAALILPALFVLLQMSLVAVSSTLPFNQRQGVLSVAPFMGISLYAAPLAWRRRDPRLLALACGGATYTFFGFLALYVTRQAQQEGVLLLGLDGAPRYMITLYPIGAATAALVLYEHRLNDAPPLARTALSGALIALMLLSFCYEYLGVRETVRKREVLVQWREQLDPQQPVVTDLWWLPAVLAPYWVKHEMYVVPYPDGLTTWLDAASSHGVEGFTFATKRPIEGVVARDAERLRTLSSESVLDLNVSEFQILEDRH